MIVLRPATMNDAELLRGWANDPTVRAASFNSTPIDEATHQQWLATRLRSGGFYIAQNEDGPVGYARVDIDGTAGEIAVSVDAPLRSHGYGRQIISAAAFRAGREFGLTEIRARIKPGNTPSWSAFVAAGFTVNGDGLVWRP